MRKKDGTVIQVVMSRNALGIRSESDVTAFLVGPDGQIVWRGDGEIDLHEVEALEVAVRALLAAPQPDPQ